MQREHNKILRGSVIIELLECNYRMNVREDKMSNHLKLSKFFCVPVQNHFNPNAQLIQLMFTWTGNQFYQLLFRRREFGNLHGRKIGGS